jgi:hypothetical protein
LAAATCSSVDGSLGVNNPPAVILRRGARANQNSRARGDIWSWRWHGNP